MRFASICSGIEAASVAFGPLGWEAAWFSEIEPFPCAVLKAHYPKTPNHGNMLDLVKRILSGEIEAPEGLFGGTPCQGFSFAGLRGSLDDGRSNLCLTFCEIADAIDTVRGRSGLPGSIIGWENVPGVLSTADNAFGCFVGRLVGNDAPCEPGPRPPEGKSNRFWKWKKPKGYSEFLHVPKWPSAGCVIGPVRRLAWRILDAQYDGLAQRRERLFVVASSRNGFDPAEILFVEKGERRDSAPRREPRKTITYDVAPCVDASGVGFSRIGDKRGQDPVSPTWWDGSDISQTLDAVLSKGQTMRRKTGFRPFWCLSRRTAIPLRLPWTHRTMKNGEPCLRASGGDCGGGSEALIAEPLPDAIGYRVHSENSNATKAGDCSIAEAADVARAMDQHGGYSQGQGGNVIVQDVTHALTGEGFDASEDGTGRGTPIIPCLFDDLPGPEVFQTRGTISSNCDRASGSAPCVAGPEDVVAFNMHKSGSVHSTLGMSVDRTDCLRAFDKSPMAVAYPESEAMAFNAKRDGAECSDVAPTLCGMNSLDSNQNNGGQVGVVINGPFEGARIPRRKMAVRRLTPRECERLQGFPDDYTKIAYRGKPAEKCPDGPRYKAIGNSWAVPVVRWIGRKIDDFLKDDRK